MRSVQTNELAVVKEVKLDGMSKKEEEDARREAKILRVLQHPNIVGFRDVYKTKKNKLNIVMEFVDNGDLD